MIETQSHIDINYPAQQTFDFIANPENNPIWQGGMKKCTIINDERPFGKGSVYSQEASFMGKTIKSTFEITEYEPGQVVAGKSLISTFPITFRRMVHDREGFSRVSAFVTGQPSGVMGVFPFFTKWLVKKSINDDYRRLKKYLEKKLKNDK